MIRRITVVLVLVVVTGCSSASPTVDTGTRSPTVPCIDSVGENSPLTVMGDALLLTPYLRVRGQVRTALEEEFYWRNKQPDDPMDARRLSAFVPGGNKTALLYPDTPAGGDAEFAAATCGLEFDWKAGLSSSEFESVVSTPGFLRGLGRRLCTDVEMSGNTTDYLARADEKLAEFEDNAAGKVDFMRAMHQNSLKDRLDFLASPEEPDELPENRRIARHDVIELRDIIARLESETDGHLLQIERDRVEFIRAALTFQCPALSD
ncbi:hypothetical protein ASG84_20535 [Rhodococcus sp. Leaf278]|uniref:hypothetical protein n=1 Tax=Rhodococcus sp. Leaf278 TaxID=1736319 RepID=UPI00070F2745|nr:hypothetical protein [Rhodococcus sp. Leaf278]KQU56546.1 hypothetical protein ASG84_20535 [Rhodococcus sp. Leaf278]